MLCSRRCSGKTRQIVLPVPHKNGHQTVVFILVVLSTWDVPAGNLDDIFHKIETFIAGFNEVKGSILASALNITPLFVEGFTSMTRVHLTKH